MTQDDLAQMSREELIQIILAQYEQLVQLKADYEALRMKLEKGKKPPTNSNNSSQPPSRDHKRSLPTDRRGARAACGSSEARAQDGGEPGSYCDSED
jgi:hypothetical protein